MGNNLNSSKLLELNIVITLIINKYNTTLFTERRQKQ